MKNKSLVQLAQEAGMVEAGLVNSRQKRGYPVIGSIISEKYKIIYYTMPAGQNEPVRILGIADSNDYETCALFNISRERLCKSAVNGRKINLDKEIPAYLDVFVPNILTAHAENEKLKKEVALRV